MKCIIPLFLLILPNSLSAQDVSLTIRSITLMVDDPEACRDWYTGYLRFTVVRSADLPGFRTITLRKNELEISLQKGEKVAPAAASTVLTFEASDIESIYAQLKKKHVAFAAEVMSESLMVGPAAPLQRFFVLKDPQGNLITIQESH